MGEGDGWGFLRVGGVAVEVPGEGLAGGVPTVLGNDPVDELRTEDKGDDLGDAFLVPAGFDASFLGSTDASFLVSTGGEEFLRGL